MKFGVLPPLPEDNDFSRWCPHDALEIDDYWIMLGYSGSCPNCADGTIKLPKEFLVQYLLDTESPNETYHVFQPLEDVRCAGCGSIVQFLSVLCPSKSYGINITAEIIEEK